MAKRLENAIHTTLRIGPLELEVDEVGVGYARSEISRLIRDSALTGRVFRIRNAKNPSVASALLMSPEILGKVLLKPARRRTLGEVLDLLPFNTIGIPRLRAGLPNNSMRVLRVPHHSKSK